MWFVNYAQPSRKIENEESGEILAGENKVEYERVDEKGDKYKRILVKFNPKFLRGSDFEIEFIPLRGSYTIGGTFITEIDSMSTINLYRWLDRHDCLAGGIIVPIKQNLKRAESLTKAWHQGKVWFEPRQVIGRVKKFYKFIAETYREPTCFMYNHFLWSGQLGSLPFGNENFNIKKLRETIEEVRYLSFTAEGEKVERSLVEHLFDTHKTKYIQENICRFLETMWLIVKRLVEEYDEKQRQE